MFDRGKTLEIWIADKSHVYIRNHTIMYISHDKNLRYNRNMQSIIKPSQISQSISCPTE